VKLNLTDSQDCVLSIGQGKDKKGQPTTVAFDGVPVWAGSDDTVATVTPAADGMSAVVHAVIPGSMKVTVSGDADLGEGVQPVAGELDVEVSAGATVTFDIVPGTPTEQ
jgi:hypothetical protein